MALKVEISGDAQMAALVSMLEGMHFQVAERIMRFIPSEEESVLYINQKQRVGVKIFEGENKVLVLKLDGQAVPVCVPCRLFFNHPEFLRAFLQEIIEPVKANGTIQSLPEA